MMQFHRERHERHFQLAFNRVAIRSDVLYSICLAVFGLLTAYQLRSVPGADGALLTTSAVLAYAPLLLLLLTRWPALYMRHRQPMVAAMKIWASFVSTLLPPQHMELLGSVARRQPPCAALAHAGAGFAAQLVLHALGLQTTGAWLVVSQGFAVAVSARAAARTCDAYLAGSVRRLLQERRRLLGHPWLVGAALAADPDWLCKVYIIGMQIAVGYCATTSLALLAEWRQRRAFALEYGFDPPSGWSLAAVGSCFLGMLCLLLRVALATMLPPAAYSGGAMGSCAAGTAGDAAGACPAAALGGT